MPKSESHIMTEYKPNFQQQTKKRELLQIKKVEGLLKVLEECKKHGALCLTDVYKLDELNEKEIQLEASYLKKRLLLKYVSNETSMGSF